MQFDNPIKESFLNKTNEVLDNVKKVLTKAGWEGHLQKEEVDKMKKTQPNLT